MASFVLLSFLSDLVMQFCVRKCLFKTLSHSLSHAFTISVLRHHPPMHTLECLQMCAQSDHTCNGHIGWFMASTLSAPFMQFPDIRLDFCSGFAQLLVYCCCAKCLIVTQDCSLCLLVPAYWKDHCCVLLLQNKPLHNFPYNTLIKAPVFFHARLLL